MSRSTSHMMLVTGACCLLGSCTPEVIETPVLQVVTVVPNHLRPPVMGRSGGVSAGHPLTSAAALEVLQNGGNAFDAGVTALLVGGVVEQDLYSLGGESLILVYPQSERKVTSIVGQGWAPRGRTIDWYLERGKNLNGYGLDPAAVLSDDARAFWDALGARYLHVLPRGTAPQAGSDAVEDVEGVLGRWLHGRDSRILIARPDRYAAADCDAADFARTTDAFANLMGAPDTAALMPTVQALADVAR